MTLNLSGVPFLSSSGQELTLQSVVMWSKYSSALRILSDTLASLVWGNAQKRDHRDTYNNQKLMLVLIIIKPCTHLKKVCNIHVLIIHAYMSLCSFFPQNPTRLKYKRNQPRSCSTNRESRGSSHVFTSTTTCSLTGDLT